VLEDFEEALDEIKTYFLTFDAAWKSPAMEALFPNHSRGLIQELERGLSKLQNRASIRRTFADWSQMGVWNASDVITLFLSARLIFLLAEAIEEEDRKLFEDACKYLLHFINFLLLTNVYPPNENQREPTRTKAILIRITPLAWQFHRLTSLRNRRLERRFLRNSATWPAMIHGLVMRSSSSWSATVCCLSEGGNSG
jgi:hypothetical protein